MPESDPLLLTQFQYELPDERIARFPLAQRDQSKLLVYRAGTIQHESFARLPGLLSEKSFLVFNNTKVIPARLHFTRTTGAVIELFLLNPVSEDDSDELPISQAMERTGTVVWQAMIGNRKRWKPGETLKTILATPTGNVLLQADWHNQEASTVRLSWQPADLSFAQLIQFAGEIPLPPYLKRDATDADRTTYQTVYSKEEGAVAAPTAGLHFTDAVFAGLLERGIGHDYVTLHVGAGTFQPIKTEDVREHHMHTEEVVYTAENVRNLLAHLDQIIAVGTTSMRALESLYWMGVKLVKNEPDPFRLDQHYAYRWFETERPAPEAALSAVVQYLTDTNQPSVVAHTGIYITPGYQLAICRGLITNFHQPGSTLILLIATLVGNDWRTIYNEALSHEYRFLSYGDSSLLLP
jgi:S-adenosylmethionine:tRNA ribosyltransferase-isomerase